MARLPSILKGVVTMDPEFWLGRWQEGRTNFHQDQVMPLLRRHWADLQIPTGSQVLVPLCGKSLDMAWLAAQGYRVLGWSCLRWRFSSSSMSKIGRAHV